MTALLEVTLEAPPILIQPLLIQPPDWYALIRGEPLRELPKDLYIPPDALEVILESFEGPLDLLLYLIRCHNLDVLDIPIAEITRQYMVYVDLMKVLRLELAAEYLVMAATLAEIKSRMLLPRPPSEVDPEADPRAELVRRLQEYEQCKLAAENIDSLPRLGRDHFMMAADPPPMEHVKPQPDVLLDEMLLALKEVLKRTHLKQSHQIVKEGLSIRERMSAILVDIAKQEFTPFISLFKINEGRAGLVVTFIAILELSKQALIEIVQIENYSSIYVKTRVAVDE
ncbi:MAG: segregation/condensation protein A [Gammaproteobacteria bacterium]|nr:segregation/condensation protein A [Gammaproteobacteria bacterium]